MSDKVEDISEEPRSEEGGTVASLSRRLWRRRLFLWITGILVLLLVIGPGGINFARRSAAVMYLQRASQAYLKEDFQAALSYADKAVYCLPAETEPRHRRGLIRYRANDLEGALEDFNQVLETAPHFAAGYASRSEVLQRLGRHGEAIRDLDKATELFPRDYSPILNQRAYARARAGMELQAGLRDIERALELSDGSPPAAYLDTQGYLLHLVGQNATALEVLEEAVRLQEEELAAATPAQEARPGDSAEERQLEQLQAEAAKRNLAVMLHHRGLVLDSLERRDEAVTDFARADELGYDPEAGVY